MRSRYQKQSAVDATALPCAHSKIRSSTSSRTRSGRREADCGRQAIPKLSREEIEEIRQWIDDYLEDHLELTNDVKAKLDQSRREIAAGEELTFNYGYDWEDHCEHPCRCGAPECVGYIVSEEFFPKLRQEGVELRSG